MYAQDDICGTVENNNQPFSGQSNNCTAWGHTDFSASIDINYLNSFPQRNMKIAIWGIEKTDGSQSISQADANDMVEYLNNIYNEFNMCFNLIHFGYIVSDDYYDTTNGTDVDTVNIFDLLYLPQVSIYDGLAIRAIIPNWAQHRGKASDSRQSYTIRAEQITAGINPHEMGHVLALRHTHNGCERVTRDPNDSNFNADTNGDYIVDTQASPQFYGTNGQYLESDCVTYTGNLTNCEEELYNITIT